MKQAIVIGVGPDRGLGAREELEVLVAGRTVVPGISL